MGDINVFSGPMKCGKSMNIINEFNRQLITGKNVMLFKPKLDERLGADIIGTRDGKQVRAPRLYFDLYADLLCEYEGKWVPLGTIDEDTFRKYTEVRIAPQKNS